MTDAQAPHIPFLIIGAGPTGLGAAHRLRELGRDDFLVLEQSPVPGGLAGSAVDPQGFTWDFGGHVVFSHYRYFDELLASLLGDEVLSHRRDARVRFLGRFVPYPFQNNIRHLPPEAAARMMDDLLDAWRMADRFDRPPADLAEWGRRTFGESIAREFFIPYNAKVWATHPSNMAYHWIGERVSTVDAKKVVRDALFQRDDVDFGPNAFFTFPLAGGTGEIWRRLAARCADRILFNTPLTSLDTAARTARAGERLFTYDRLLFTGPLDILAQKIATDAPDAVRQAASGLVHNGVLVAGIGVSGERPDTKTWMYFPESDCPFYRVTNFHNYSPRNVPALDGRYGRYRAFMTEVSYSTDKPEDASTHLDRVEQGLTAVTLMDRADRERVVTRFETNLPYGYPVPTKGRDAALAVIQPFFASRGVDARGRFGGWKYEVANMDHCLMQGVEWAQRQLLGAPETTYTL